MTITVSTTDPRSCKALALLESVDKWLRIRRKGDGVKFYVIPGSAGTSTGRTAVSAPARTRSTGALSASTSPRSSSTLRRFRRGGQRAAPIPWRMAGRLTCR